MPRTRITKDSTIDQIMAPVFRARNELVQLAHQSMEAQMFLGPELVADAQKVRNLEALASVQIDYVRVMQTEPGDNARNRFLMSVMTRGADDRWSGRENDSKRSAFDAVAKWVSEEFDAIRYEG